MELLGCDPKPFVSAGKGRAFNAWGYGDFGAAEENAIRAVGGADGADGAAVAGGCLKSEGRLKVETSSLRDCRLQLWSEVAENQVNWQHTEVGFLEVGFSGVQQHQSFGRVPPPGSHELVG